MTFPIRVGVFISQQRRSWDLVRAAFIAADAMGFELGWVNDHFVSVDDDVSRSNLEAWTTLAGIAAVTSHIRLGVLVTGVTFRQPAVLAREAVTVDHIGHGRLEFGIGAAWNEREHEAYGIPFPPPLERVERLEEALDVILATWMQEGSSYHGRHYQLNNAPAEPKPVQQPHPPIRIGGTGTRLLSIVARYADTWDYTGPADELSARGAVLDDQCERIGRDPTTVRWSATLPRQHIESTEQLLGVVQPYLDAGATDINVGFGLPTDPATMMRQLATVYEVKERLMV